MTHNILAAIVLYHPNMDQIERMIVALCNDIVRLALYLNSPVDANMRARLERKAPMQIDWIGSGTNCGLGKAYNDCLDHAERVGCNHLLLFDQDSLPPMGLAAALDGALRNLGTANRRPIAVGPTTFDLDGRVIKAPVLNSTLCAGSVETSFLISSGKMIDVVAARRVGSFREDFFIDGIDIEWCLRARHLGYSVWMHQDVRMDHVLGAGVIVLPFGILRVTRQPPLRVYTLIRNQIAMLRLAHVPRTFKLRLVLTLPARMLTYVWTDPSRAMRKALWRGLRDGVRNRLGPPQRVLR